MPEGLISNTPPSGVSGILNTRLSIGKSDGVYMSWGIGQY